MATCRNCGNTALEWKQDSGRWFLFDPKRNLSHTKNDCEDFTLLTRAEELASTAVRPDVRKGSRVTLRDGQYAGTVEALTAPKPTSEIKHVWRRDRHRWSSKIKHIRGDVFALIKWDDEQAARMADLLKWQNTRNLQVE